MPRVVHFEIHADDPQRAIRFYTELFGWQFPEWFPGYWGVITGESGTPGIDGGLMERRGDRPTIGQPLSSFSCVVDVPSIDEYSAKAVAAGATVALPKQPIPGVGYSAYFIDTEGNIFGMFQDDSTAT